MKKILFVCLGNICRSPMVEAQFQDYVQKENLTKEFTCDSAGTGRYHLGSLPHVNTRQILSNNHIQTTHKARQLIKQDFYDFDVILAMDSSIFREIHAMQKAFFDERELALVQEQCKIKLFRSFDPQNESLEVPDPYYGTIEDYKNVYSICNRTIPHLINALLEM